MKALIARAYGDLDELAVVDVGEPVPGPTQVVIEVRAAGVNPADVKRLRGQFGRGGSTPLRFGSEVAGVVLAVGSEVTHVHDGDEVIAYPVSGGIAERVAVAASSVFPKPRSLGWTEAAGLLLTGGTAVHAITAVGLHEGDTLVVHGASGSAGLTVVQLARLRGATVIGTAGPSRQNLLASFGAHPTTYGDGLLERLREILPDGASAAIDTVGSQEAIDTSLALVHDPSRIVSINGFGKTEGTAIRLLGGGPGADAGNDIRRAARGELVSLAGAGDLHVVVGRTFALTDAPAALALAIGGHPGGKVVVTP